MVVLGVFMFITICIREILKYWQFHRSSDTYYLSQSWSIPSVCIHRWVCVDMHPCIHHGSEFIIYLAHIWRQIPIVNSTCYHLSDPKADLEMRSSNSTFTLQLSQLLQFPAQRCTRLLLQTQGHQSHYLLLCLHDREKYQQASQKNTKKWHIIYWKLGNR